MLTGSCESHLGTRHPETAVVTHVIHISSARVHAPLSHGTSPTKHELEDKIGDNKTLNQEWGPWERCVLWTVKATSHVHEAGPGPGPLFPLQIGKLRPRNKWDPDEVIGDQTRT